MDFLTDSMDMKIRELLKEVHLDYSFAKTLDGVVSSVVDAIKSIPDQEVSSKDARKFVRDLRVPTSKANFTFRAPEFVQIGGSHSIRAIVKPNIIVDLLVRMPKECFHEKDYLNHRYHAKRCLYMQVIEKSLKSSPLVRKIEWTTFQNEARKPILLLYPVMKDSGLSEFYIKLVPTATSLFNPSKMKLSRNNLRALNQEGDTTHASPKYNSSILEDMFLEENAEFVKKVFHEWKSLEEALVLLKVWARNRSSIFTHDCLSGYLISIIMSYLAVGSGGNRITKSMNTMQIFRVTLKNLSSSMWNRGIYLKPPSQCDLSKEDMAQFLDSTGVAFCDVSGHVNLAFRMTRSALSELQDEAAWTLSCIDKYKDGGFEEIFMTKVDFAARFDSCIRINFKGNAKVYSSDFCLDDECWRTCERDVHSHLQQALTDRAKLVRVTWRTTPTNWNIKDGMSGFGKEAMIVGILFSSHEQSFRVVDVGPNAENKEEVIKFRKFWGEKSELRRFRDGTIAESTVWECEPWERHLIIKRITDYILMKHFLLATEDMVHISDQLDFVLHLRGKDPVSFSTSLFGAFEILSKRLRLLDEIPLKISSVQPLDPAFRHTSVFPPEPHPLAFQKGKIIPKFVATCLQPVEVMFQLEGSGNWPLDNVAIEKTKSAFLLKIGECLQKRWGNFCTATEDNVDVLMSGYAFRLKILHERGLNLMKTQVNGIASVDKDLFLRGQHSSMINGLHGRYPIYGPVVRLAKRWVSAHLFSSFLKEEAVELIVAYLFLKPFPFHAPCSRVTGFLRFLRLLSNYDWTFTPLIVDINGDFTSNDEKEINETFILSRKKYEENSQDIETAMFLATTYDKVSEAWTIFSPNRLVLKRMASYARSSADLLTNLILQGDTGSSYTWECLVRTPLNNYDAIVLLHQEKLCYPQRLLFPTEINHGKHVIQGKPSMDFHPYMAFANAFGSLEEARTKLMVDFDPTNYFLEDLKAEFPDTFKVWYDSLGGDAIGLTWERKGAKKQKRNRDDAEETRDPVDILKDVGKVGKGYVKSVYLVKTPRMGR